MKIVIDTNVLVQIMQNEGAKDLRDPETGQVVDNAFMRAQALVERIEAIKGVVVLPAPVLAEYLIGIRRDSCAGLLRFSAPLSPIRQSLQR